MVNMFMRSPITLMNKIAIFLLKYLDHVDKNNPRIFQLNCKSVGEQEYKSNLPRYHW